MTRLTLILGLVLILGPNALRAQQQDYAGTGVDLCDCLPSASYLLLKKTVSVPGQPLEVDFMGNVEVLITFLSAYGHIGPHPMNLNWPNDLVVGSADLTNMLTGYNQYFEFEETLCSWEVVNVASHGWILQNIDLTLESEAYVHESTYDEFESDGDTYGQCLLNSFDLEMVHLPDSVVRLTFVRKYLGNDIVD